jgi:hypothetical protein
MTGESDRSLRARANERVLALVAEALDLIDAHGLPADAAAHLELARERLLHPSK